ncbi:hypothetical protein XFF7767_170032 [Xanthomonas citri pv. fuscans]|nr:hypothetical protein XFF6960_310031 [Xanthomonas citri pv. fuscans]SOO03555.1 hypothetical protein XFF7767_170032 [Xanthomonas citri pv. fuscans]SOO16499.1 hypothetical protein XFF7766_80031 [Xanthomonas citri pv. fuscans]SOO43100.1 hypothetical protein XFF1815_310029 [Xanthomonas citri pv. fuscans]
MCTAHPGRCVLAALAAISRKQAGGCARDRQRPERMPKIATARRTITGTASASSVRYSADHALRVVGR